MTRLSAMRLQYESQAVEFAFVPAGNPTRATGQLL